MSRILTPFRHPHKVAPYVEALRLAGGDPSAVGVDASPALDDVRGLLLTGGTDLNSQLYNQPSHTEADAPDDERDRVELGLLSAALERDLPILAICRGFQLLNVHHGGTLHQHLGLPEHDRTGGNQSESVHQVILEPNSHLAQIYGSTEIAVNSRHHQAVDRIGGNLRVAGHSRTNPALVEALESPTRRFVLGVQWHPEDQAPRHADHLELFRRFVLACG